MQPLAFHLRNSTVRTRRRAQAMALSREQTILPTVCSERASRGVTQFRPLRRHYIGDIGAAGGGHTGLRRLDACIDARRETAVPTSATLPERHRRAGLKLQERLASITPVTTSLSQGHGKAKRGPGCSSARGACHLAMFSARHFSARSPGTSLRGRSSYDLQ